MAATFKLTALVELYQHELDRYRTMLALAEEQKKCVEASDYQVLVEILERRDHIAKEIDQASLRVRQLCQEISQELGLPELNLTNLRPKISDQLLNPLTAVLAEITAVIEQIQTADQVSESQIKQVLGLLRGQMNEMQRGRVALRAYKQAPTLRDARFIDKQK